MDWFLYDTASVMKELTHFMPLVYFNTTWKYHWSISENLLTFTCSKSTINNRNTRKRCEICSKSTIETPERRQWRKGKEIVNFFFFLIHCVKSVQTWSFFWPVFSCIPTEYGDLFRKSPYSGRIQENTDQKNSVFGHISCIGWLIKKQMVCRRFFSCEQQDDQYVTSHYCSGSLLLANTKSK